MSLVERFTKFWLKRVEKPALGRMPADRPDKFRKRFALQAKLLFPAPRGSTITPHPIAGLEGLAVTGPGGALRPCEVLYFHGGAYVFGSPRTHAGMLARLVGRCGLRAVLPDYPKAPENPFPAALDGAVAAYKELSAEGAPIVLGGDSAGGGLALALLARICAEGLPQPVMTFAFSPWTDLAMTGQSLTTNVGTELFLPVDRIGEARDIYLDGADAKDPRASPLYGAFAGAGPVRIWVSDSEVLLDDSRNMIAELTAQGVDARLITEQDQPHVWPIFPGWILPAAERTLDQVAAEIQTSLDRANR